MINPLDRAPSKPVAPDEREIHVIPTGGTEPMHYLSSSCWCYPLKEGEVVTHNAKDCRERFTRQGLRLKDNQAYALVTVTK